MINFVSILLNIKTNNIERDKYYMHFNCTEYKRLNTLDDPRCIQFINQIKLLDWESYQFWVYGGILNKSSTRDLDGTIVGPWNPDKIRLLLDGVYTAAFGLQIEPDIKYQTNEQLFNPDSSELSGYPPGVLFMNNQMYRFGELGKGNLRWKSTPIRNPKLRKQLI